MSAQSELGVEWGCGSERKWREREKCVQTKMYKVSENIINILKYVG